MADSQSAGARVLVLHSSRFGMSTRIAQAVCDQLSAAGLNPDLQALDATSTPTDYDALVMVMSVRYGHFDKAAFHLVKQHRAWLDAHPTMVMTVSLTARTPEKRDPTVHSYTVKFLQQAAWTPTHTEVVAGQLDYPSYKIWDRLAIQMIMSMTKGPTDPKTVIEYTDWDRVRAAADEFADTVKA